jgi:hypothetical protein
MLIPRSSTGNRKHECRWWSLDTLGMTLMCALLIGLPAGCGNLDESGTSDLVMARVKDAVNLDPSHATDGLSLNVSWRAW